jgi:hypothetical protein
LTNPSDRVGAVVTRRVNDFKVLDPVVMTVPVFVVDVFGGQ